MHDPLPRVMLVPGLGLFGLGTSANDARIAADIAEAAVEGITGAEAIGAFNPISEADTFDIEYWSLELAKLGQRKPLPLAGQVAVITGAGGTIGGATARAFVQAGAEVALLDVDAAAATKQAKAIGGPALAIACDVTDMGSCATLSARSSKLLAALISRCPTPVGRGKARSARSKKTAARKFRTQFLRSPKGCPGRGEHHAQTRHWRLLAIQRFQTGGKPGAESGPYGLPKAATLLLMRQYALDYGPTVSAPTQSTPTVSVPAC